MESLLEPFDETLSTSKHKTRLSHLCESLVFTFIKNKADKARVCAERIQGFEHEELYHGLYTICRRKSLNNLVRVHKQNGQIILVRNKPNE